MKKFFVVKRVLLLMAALAFSAAVSVNVKAVNIVFDPNVEEISGDIPVDQALSKGADVVKFTFSWDGVVPANTNVDIHYFMGDKKFRDEYKTVSTEIKIKYGTNYIPGNSLYSVCQGSNINYVLMLVDEHYVLNLTLDRRPEKFRRVTGIGINSTGMTLTTGKLSGLRASLSTEGCPGGAYDSTVFFSSSNSDVVAVDSESGGIMARRSGRATITATSLDGGYSKTCNVVVFDDMSFPFEFQEEEEHIEPEEASTEKEQFKSVIPANSVYSSTGGASGSVVPMVGANLSERDDINQEFLANAFAASMGKTATIVTECTIYPTRLLSEKENGSLQTLTFGNIPGNTGENVYGLAYNTTDGAYIMETTLAADKTAKFEDYKLRSATNLSVFLCK